MLIEAIAQVESSLSQPWMQYGAFGLLAIIVLYFIKSVIPQYIANMKAVSVEFTQSLEKLSVAHRQERADDRASFFQERKIDRDHFNEAVKVQTATIAAAAERQASAVNLNTEATQRLTATFKGACVNAPRD